MNRATAEAVEDLGIVKGQRVIAICKSSNVFVLREEESIDNMLQGRIVSLEEGEEGIKIIVDIGGYDRIVSVIQAKYPAVAMLEAGQAVTLVVKPKDVMIGK